MSLLVCMSFHILPGIVLSVFFYFFLAMSFLVHVVSFGLCVFLTLWVLTYASVQLPRYLYYIYFAYLALDINLTMPMQFPLSKSSDKHI